MTGRDAGVGGDQGGRSAGRSCSKDFAAWAARLFVLIQNSRVVVGSRPLESRGSTKTFRFASILPQGPAARQEGAAEGWGRLLPHYSGSYSAASQH